MIGSKSQRRGRTAAGFAAAVLAALCALGVGALGVAAPTGPASAPAVVAPAAPTPPASAALPTAAHALTAQDLEPWLDGLMPTALKTARTPGAVVVVVKDGQVLLEKGYGFADWKKRTPVDPKTTLFRPGSTSKLFTWTAVMQQVEAGKLNLDADVNTYLDFKIPPYQGKPVTLRLLMTHRAGFEETARDLLTYGKAPPPLGEVMKRYVPPRFLTPDEGPAYSNYGASLAGYIVERVSGEPFNQYVQRHIFAPLGMTSSTFDQPLPATMAPHMATGYATWDQPGPGFEIVDMPPAGALSSTGDDMARFMIAQLQLGRCGSAQILQPQTAQAMHTTIWRAFPDLNGNALGFYQQNINGHRVVAHGGDTNFFHTDLSLFIDDNVGLFISVNARGKDGMGEFLRDKLFTEFADRYFPAAAPPPASSVDAATAKAHAAMIAGPYITTRRADSNFLALIQLIQPNVVKANADGSITAAPLGTAERFVEVSPFLWQQFNGHDRIQATASGGKVTRWSSDSAAPIFVYVRPGGLAGAGLELPLTLASLGFLVLTALSWPGAALARRRYRQSFPHSGARALLYRLTRVCAWLAPAAVILWAVVVQLVSETTGAAVGLILHSAQAVSFLAFAGGTAAALANLWLVFTRKAELSARIFAVVLLAAFAFMLWIALHYHLIGVSGQY
ncbi:MAG TPA: serine hydrolase domain-containing protein [Caulobacteraceae bacterium]|nr:serine hydrolase domain-containing protein [Caulobacteraceae bacterium]